MSTPIIHDDKTFFQLLDPSQAPQQHSMRPYSVLKTKIIRVEAMLDKISNNIKATGLKPSKFAKIEEDLKAVQRRRRTGQATRRS